VDEEKLSEILDGLLILYQLIQKNIFKPNPIGNGIKMSFTIHFILLTLKSVNKLPISETGKLMCIKKQNMTYIADKLVENGLIRRVPDLNDRRVINIIITDKGKEYVDDWQKNRINIMRQNFTCFDDDDLKKMNKSVDNIKYALSKMHND
jgi:DNA-binding MarR family transcriptional regulator